MYNGKYNMPAGMDYTKRTESYEDYLVRTASNSDYDKRVKRAILAKKKKRGY